MLALATGTSPTLLAALVAAGGVLGAALIAGWVQLRSQSAEDQLAAIDALVRKYADQTTDQIVDAVEKCVAEKLDARTRGLYIAEIVKRALREVLGDDRRRRRWYDQ